jgi:spore germination cell wall hydrolase CwlJ-like protein
MNYLSLKYFAAILLLAILTICPTLFAQDAIEIYQIDEPTTSVVDQKQIQCLAENIYFEARGEPYLGKVAVARVVMNRVDNAAFNDTPCEVIYESAYVTRVIDGTTRKVKVCQFSWACGPKRKIKEDDPMFVVSMKIAQKVLLTDAYRDIIPKTMLFFHSAAIQPNWGYRQAMRIGNHIFYSRHK